MKSFTETIDRAKIPEKYKRNKSKMLTSLQILKQGVESMKIETTSTKVTELMIDKESCLLRELTREAKFTTTTLYLGEEEGYSGVTENNVPYTITPRFLVKNLQSQYRDLSVFWFLREENSLDIMSFLAEHRFFSVVYSIEFQEPVKPVEFQEPVKPVEFQEPVKPVEFQEPVKPKVFSYASIVKKSMEIDSSSDNTDHDTISVTSQELIPVPSHYRGGAYGKTEYENVREYYEKWGKHRMFVMFGTKGENFSRLDKLNIRHVMNTVLLYRKYQEIIRDNEYYYVKIVRNFHYDLSKKKDTLHFNFVFKNEYHASDVFHVYTNEARNDLDRVTTLSVDRR